MRHTINYIKKKLHNSKLCRNFLLLLTVATLCISALCVPISAESPLNDNTTNYYGFWLSNDALEMEEAENTTRIFYDSSNNPSYLPLKCITTNDINDDYQNGNIIIPESLKVYTVQSTDYAPNVYVDINDTTYCIWNAESSYGHNETVIYFLYENSQDVSLATKNIFKYNDEYIYENISHGEFELTQTGIFNIFGNIGNWITNAISNLTSMFWANGSLTFIGVLAVGGLGISIVLILIRLISSFLAFRG